MTIKGSLDQLTTKGAQGWIYAKSESGPVVVEAVLHHRVVGEALADIYRHDLAAVGFGDGRCGFTIDFDMPIEAAYLPLVTVRPTGGDVELPRFSTSGFTDFLSGLYTALPLTGRQKSVYGGLWTDRTDALSLLAGRKSLDRFSGEAARVLEHLIVHGHALIDLPYGEAPDIEGHDVSELERTLGGVFFRHLVQDILTASFDDVPVLISGRVLTGSQREFRQPSTGQHLSSPVESLALIASNGNSPSSIELIRDSHNFPDFTSSGDPRWLLPAGSSALSHAASIGAPIEIVTLRANQVAILASGTIYRVLHPSADGTVEALTIPRRRQPVRQDVGRPYCEASNVGGRIALPTAA